jgi:hypothetical protein
LPASSPRWLTAQVDRRLADFESALLAADYLDDLTEPVERSSERLL